MTLPFYGGIDPRRHTPQIGLFTWIAFVKKPCDMQEAVNVFLTHSGLEYCSNCTVSVLSTENGDAPRWSECDLRTGTHLPVPQGRERCSH